MQQQLKIYLLTAISALSLLTVVGQEQLHVEVGFETYFDNKEYASCDYSATNLDFSSGTDFAVRLAPQLSWQWSEANSLSFGASLMQPFGEYDNPFFSSVEPIIYYAFKTERVTAAAGIFPRTLGHIDSYSTAFFSNDYLFYDNLQSGLYGAYNIGESFIELGIDWEGQYSELEREKFRLLSAARRYYRHLFIGYNMSLMHYACQDAPEMDNVVDAILLEPAVGVRFSAYFDFEIAASMLQSMQRDRTYGDSWLMPRMGSLSIKMERWGLYLDERLYLGENINPLFFGATTASGEQLSYGRELYPSDGFFRTEEGVYNRAALGYKQRFFDDTLSVKGEFVTHYDGSGLGVQQIVELGVNIDKVLYNSEKHRK